MVPAKDMDPVSHRSDTLQLLKQRLAQNVPASAKPNLWMEINAFKNKQFEAKDELMAKRKKDLLNQTAQTQMLQAEKNLEVRRNRNLEVKAERVLAD